MKIQSLFLNFFIPLCVFVFSEKAEAQLGFCNGNSGDPIFTENFGAGTSYGPPLQVGVTNYDFVNFNGPQDGEYTVGPNTFGNGWNLPSDHTPGDTNGKALIVNASFTAGEFYTRTINGLCENTTYEFSSWLINILPSSGCGGNGIPINVKFQIWDITDSSLLASGDTGDIPGTASPNWQQYGLVFQTLSNQTSVILKMINNGIGGCGNDLAIDDIVFKSCGDTITTSDIEGNNNITLCESETPYSTTLTATPDNTVFNAHFYQWEESTNGVTWTDILGETSQSLIISNITSSRLYRAKIAESDINLNNLLCNVTSDIFQITINPIPMAPTLQCWENTTFNDSTCTWDIFGSQPTQPSIECWETATFNNNSCEWEVSGNLPPQPIIECWEITTFNDSTCSWEITGTQPLQPSTECWEAAIFNSLTCAWEITGTQPLQPTIECWEITEFNTVTCNWDVIGELPIIENILSFENSIIITTSNTGDFLYSLDGINFQSNNIFQNIENDLYTVFIKVNNCNEMVTEEHLHFYIPQFFTPNNDGKNDTFDLKGIENYNSSEVYIYDRFGKILKTAINKPFSWNGVYKGSPLPSTDYWYYIIIEGKHIQGHITLKR